MRNKKKEPQKETELDYGPPSFLKVLFLGGVGEFGKNMTAFECGDDILIVDCGSMFPHLDQLGIDLVIPDTTYLQQHRQNIRGLVLTHGHEDHIGAVPYVIEQLGGKLDLYGGRLTLALTESKLREHRNTDKARMHVVKAGDGVRLGEFYVEFIHINHSIVDSLSVAIHTPAGVIVMTSDFKIDFTPVGNPVADLQTFADLGRKGVLALMMDSTNVEEEGYSLSESFVGGMFDQYFETAKGRILVAMFASNISRIQQAADMALKHDRFLCMNGRSMVNNAQIAQELGLLKIPDGRLIDIADIDRFRDDELVILTTGSQGEPMSALTRIAFDEHRQLDIRQSDTVIVSASAIPGNELAIGRVIDQLFKKGARVIYEGLADVHASGHACQEELKLMHALLKPRYFIPVHGEYRHLTQHKRLAERMGMAEERIFVPEMGDVLVLEEDNAYFAKETCPVGSVLVDGLGVGDVGTVVLRDRRHLSQDGLVVVVVSVDKRAKKLFGDPDIVTRGFVYAKDNEGLIEEMRQSVRRSVKEAAGGEPDFTEAVKKHIREDLRSFLYGKTKRGPMILPVVVSL